MRHPRIPPAAHSKSAFLSQVCGSGGAAKRRFEESAHARWTKPIHIFVKEESFQPEFIGDGHSLQSAHDHERSRPSIRGHAGLGNHRDRRWGRRQRAATARVHCVREPSSVNLDSTTIVARSGYRGIVERKHGERRTCGAVGTLYSHGPRAAVGLEAKGPELAIDCYEYLGNAELAGDFGQTIHCVAFGYP